MKLTKREKQEIKEFTELVEKRHNKNIKLIKLYGSAARNNLRRDSDLDILIVSRNKNQKLREAIFDIATDMILKYNRVISPKIIDEKRYKYLSWLEIPFIENIKKEGEILWQTKLKSK